MKKTGTKNLFYKNLIIILLAGNLCFLNTNAQIISYPTSAQTLIRGFGSALLNVKIDFPTCSDLKVTINLGATNSPGVIDYIPGTVIKTAGSATITEFNITDLRNPIFQISNTSPGESITFTIDRKSECGFPISTKDFILVTGTGAGCNFSDINPNTNGYLLRAPALTVNAPVPITNAALNGVYTRNFSIVNGGNGITDTVRFYTIYEAGKSKNTSLSNAITANGTPFTPWKTNGDTLFYKIFGATLFGADNIFLNGEVVNIIEEIEVLGCNPIIKYAAQWGRNLQNICATTFGQSGITMSNAVPKLVLSVPTPQYDHCFTGDVKIQQVRITNTGGGPASDVGLYVTNYWPGSFTGNVTFDTSQVWVVRSSSGAILGAVKNFNSLTTSSSYYNQACLLPSRMTSGRGSFTNNIIIAPGDYVTVDIYIESVNMSCYGTSCYGSGLGWIALRTQLTYKNQCGTANYAEAETNDVGRAYMYFLMAPNVPSDIIGGVPFNIDIYLTELRTVNNPNGTGTTYLCLPLAGLNMLPTTSTVTFDSRTFNVAVTNDTMFIGPIPQNITYSNPGNMRIPMMPTCGVGGTKTLNFFFLNKYSNCSPLVKYECKTTLTFLHCPSPCPKGGATPLNFSLKRITYGLPDNDDNGRPDATGALDLNAINDHNSVNGDTLLGKWNIKVYPNVESTTNGYTTTDPNFGNRIAYVYVDFKYNQYGPSYPNYPGELSPIINATATIYPAGGGTPIIVTPTVTLDGYKAHYTLDSIQRGMSWQGGDSIVFEAKYRVNQTNADVLEKWNPAGFNLFITNNEVYSTYTPKTTPQTAPILGQTYTCDHFNDYNQMSRIWLSPWIPASQPINGCDGNNLLAQMRQYLRNQEPRGIFPYEYRNFFIPDSMTVIIPPGFSYRSGSAILQSPNFNSTSYPIPNAQVVQVGNKLYFINLKNYYTRFGGPIIAGDEAEYINVYFKLNPECDAVNGTFESQHHTSGIGNEVNTPLSYGTTSRPTYSWDYLVQGVGWVYTAPQPVLSGGGLIVSSNGSATWNIVLQNAHASVAAVNSFFTVTPASGFTNIVVKEGGVSINPINGIYQLSSLISNANRLLTLSATTSTCNIDSMRINYGWDCIKYPLSTTTTNCTTPLWLKMDNSISQMQLYVDKQPTGPDISLCDVDDIEFVFNSAQTSNVNNPQIRIVPPNGAIINSAEIEYPLGSGNFEPITPTIVGGVYVYSLEDHSFILPDGLLGTAQSPSQPNRAAKLIIYYATTCQFSSGSRFYAQIRGERPCGGNIPISQGYNAFLRTDPIFITGSPAGSLFSFNLGLSSTVIACGQTRISGSVTPIGGPSTNTDTILVTIPNGLTYNGGFLSSTGVTVISGYPIAGPNNTQILALKIPSGIAIGTVIDYGFDITANANSGCTDFNIFSEVKRSYSTFNCAGVPCNNPFSAIIGSQSNTLTVSRPNPVINYVTYASGNFIANDSAMVNVTITNTHPTLNAVANTLAIEFYCGVPGSLFETILLPIAINANSSITHQFNVHFVGSPLCATGDVLTAAIRPFTSLCICDSSSYTLPGVVLPVKFKGFTAQKANNISLLKWQITEKARNIIFGVQRSINGISFSNIGTIQGSEALTYQFLDQNPIKGKRNYYRIVQQSNATNASKTEVKLLEFLFEDQIQVTTGATSSFWTIQLGNYYSSKRNVIQIFTSTGQLVVNRLIPFNTLFSEVAVQNLTNGTYIVKVVSEDATIYTQKASKF